MDQKEQIVADLSTLLGSKNVLTDPTALSVYECDAAPSFKAMPDVVVFADTAKQVSDIVKLANKYSVPFIARGRRHGFEWWHALCSRRDHYRPQSHGSYFRDRS